MLLNQRTPLRAFLKYLPSYFKLSLKRLKTWSNRLTECTICKQYYWYLNTETHYKNRHPSPQSTRDYLSGGTRTAEGTCEGSGRQENQEAKALGSE